MKMRRKTAIVICLALCMLFALTGPVLAFTDTAGHWAEGTILEWDGNGLINGYQDGTFKPDDSITRAEFVTLVNHSFNYTLEADATFTDVNPPDWFAGEVARAVAAGYISGYEDNTFQPNQPIERQEVAVILARLLALETDSVAVLDFADAAITPDWSRPSIAAVAKNNLMKGYPDQTFQPQSPITRAEALVCLDRALKVKEPKSHAISGMVTMNAKEESGAVVRLFKANDFKVVQEVTTSSDGKFMMAVSTGKYDLTAVSADAVAYATGIEVGAEAVTRDLDLKPAAIISGTITDSNDSKVKNTTVLYTAAATFLSSTDNNGRYKISVPPNQNYTVRVYKPGSPSAEPVTAGEKLLLSGDAGAQDVGDLRVTFPSSGGGGGGGGGHNVRIVPPVSDAVVDNAVDDAVAGNTPTVAVDQTTVPEIAFTPTQLDKIADSDRPLDITVQGGVQFTLPVQSVDELANKQEQVQFIAKPVAGTPPADQSYQIAGQSYDLEVQTVINGRVQNVTFSTPVSIVLPASQPSGPGQVLRVFKYHELTGNWAEVEATDNGNGTVTITRSSFSRYMPAYTPDMVTIDSVTIMLDKSPDKKASVYHELISGKLYIVADFDLANLPLTEQIMSGKINATKLPQNPKLEMNITVPVVNIKKSITQDLTTGSNELQVLEVFSGILTLEKLHRVYGSYMVLPGRFLYDGGTRDVKLKLTLP